VTRDAADTYWTIDTALGPAFIACNGTGISTIMRANGTSAFEKAFYAEFGRPAHPAAEPPEPLASAVTARLNGQLSTAEAQKVLRFDLRGRTDFERAVLLKTAEIPYGEVRSYSWIAKEIGRPLAVRAVGSAEARNPVPLLIPCHRVVRRDGHIGAYGLGGASAKRALLAAEGIDPDWIERLARAGIRYVGNPSTRTYCFPTCHQARQILEDDRVAFGSDDEAVALGYRPCERCRPFGRPSG
jgi:O-6-methylguanine DNA methyltransferase